MSGMCFACLKCEKSYRYPKYKGRLSFGNITVVVNQTPDIIDLTPVCPKCGADVNEF